MNKENTTMRLSALLLTLVISVSAKLWAQEAYAVLSDNETVISESEEGMVYGKTLTFYYDDQKEERGGMSVGPFTRFSYNGESQKYEVEGRGWNDYSEIIMTVVFDDSFANDSTLTSTAYWFVSCDNLTNISGIRNLNTANVTNMRFMFYGCSSLTSLDVSNFNTANVTDMRGMFWGCSNLASLDVSRFNTDNVTDMYAMFYGCSSLTSLDISNFNTDNVTDMGYMFDGCSSLTSLDISNFNTANVTNMRFMFYGCSSLTSLDVSNFNTANVTNMRFMFYGCSSLTSLDVSNFNTTNVTDMSYMFDFCLDLTSLDVSNFNTANVTEMGGMFSSCSSLASLDVSKFNTDNVTDMYGMFSYCPNLASLDVSNFNTANVTNMRLMFYGCSSLTSLDISNFNTANVTDMGGMFDGCSSLTTIYAGNEWSTANVTSGDGMFVWCTALVGGAGTVYDAEHVDASYAHIDGGVDNPGYFTDINAPVGIATFDGLVATVSGERTLDEAFRQVGGRAEAAKTIAAIIWNKDEALTQDDLQGIDNPNLLVYAADRALVPYTVNNVVVGGVARNLILTDNGTGNCNFYCPLSFTAQHATYSRDFSQRTQPGVSQGWETLALPFDVREMRHATRGAILPFGATGNGRHFWLRRQTAEGGLAQATGIEANRAYLVSMPNSDSYDDSYNLAGRVTFSATDVTIPVTAVADSTGNGIRLTAAFQRIEPSPVVYAINRGEAYGGYAEGSVFVSGLREVRPFEAYTLHQDTTVPAPLYIPIDGESWLTDITPTSADMQPGTGQYYDLQGRRVAQPTNASHTSTFRLTKGLYIVNGRKAIVK